MAEAGTKKRLVDYLESQDRVAAARLEAENIQARLDEMTLEQLEALDSRFSDIMCMVQHAKESLAVLSRVIRTKGSRRR